MKSIGYAIIGICLAGAANACPDWRYDGNQSYVFTARELYQPVHLPVVAGGSQRTASCPIRAINYRGPLPGYSIPQPDFSVTVLGLDGYALEFRTISHCDSTLLVNTAAQNWYFDDDDNTESPSDAKIRLTRPAGDGRYDVWIGTFDGARCNAELVLETFR
jgi:hypothetical protein